MNIKRNKELKERLSSDENATLKKMSKGQIIYLTKYAKDIFFECCADCKQKMIKDSKSISDINDLCMKCKNNSDIVDLFKKIEGIYNEIKSKDDE
jgi:hypothetical protein